MIYLNESLYSMAAFSFLLLLLSNYNVCIRMLVEVECWQGRMLVKVECWQKLTTSVLSKLKASHL